MDKLGVAPRAGAWIETQISTGGLSLRPLSPPARGRGLKHCFLDPLPRYMSVAPRAGAWIETGYNIVNLLPLVVAPRAGAWIETTPSSSSSW